MQNIHDQIFTRNYGVISREEQTRLTDAKVTVVGAGGVGGMTLISLARMGVGHIHIIDMDVFEHSNINRQMLSSLSRIGKSKALCAQETLEDINPLLKVSITQEKLVEENAERLFTGADVIIDATDNLVSRVIIHRAAQKMQIPSVWIAVTPPFRGGVMTFSHATPPYELVLNHPSYQQPLTPEVMEKISQIKHQRAKTAAKLGALADWADAFTKGTAPWAVLCPVANIVGILASFEAFKVILKRDNLPPTYAPQLAKIDLSQPNMISVEHPAEGSWDNGLL
jgi:sulfur-carrier protein adenylyltransferase/sulfurtransferase